MSNASEHTLNLGPANARPNLTIGALGSQTAHKLHATFRFHVRAAVSQLARAAHCTACAIVRPSRR